MYGKNAHSAYQSVQITTTDRGRLLLMMSRLGVIRRRVAIFVAAAEDRETAPAQHEMLFLRPPSRGCQTVLAGILPNVLSTFLFHRL